jgi:hypothetical protein
VSRWSRGKRKIVMLEWGDSQFPHITAVDSALQHWFILAGSVGSKGETISVGSRLLCCLAKFRQRLCLRMCPLRQGTGVPGQMCRDEPFVPVGRNADADDALLISRCGCDRPCSLGSRRRAESEVISCEGRVAGPCVNHDSLHGIAARGQTGER